MLKRAFDLLIATPGLIVLSPLLLGIMIAVRLGSPGPALFRQTRVGRNGRDFTLYKFRTMAVRAGSESGSFDAGDRSRVTRVGGFLRATKLDELPQLWNVVRGDMSLVGPRPEVRQWVQAFPDRWAVVHSVKPGITDPAAIEFFHEEQILAGAPDPVQAYRETVLPRKLDLYQQYVEGRSFWGDLRIVLKTGLLTLGLRPR
jgi:lipopolysaccharide/colanic/teichoic acid biosynthesis glycosyltransferase